MSSPDVFENLFPLETQSAGETIRVGERLGACLAAGDVVALYGDLGAGKTQFVRGLCRGVGLDETAVTSPTFTLIHEYPGPTPVFHLDMYRIENAGKARSLGLDDYLFGEGICVIEWPDIIADELPASTVRIRIEHLDQSRRRLSLLT
jgi:tRNA threonylcarbamoyladenosine biosynthesis protein TsaE